MSSLKMTGLTKFIAEIRKSTNQEAETKIVEAEMKKIRSKFSSGKSMNGYNKKKYVLKLLYIKLLGYRVDIGHSQIESLIKGNNYSEIYSGCISAAGLIQENDEDTYKKFLKSLASHLFSPKPEIQNLALNLIGGLANKTLAEGLVNEVMKLALGESSKISAYIRKKVGFYFYGYDNSFFIFENFLVKILNNNYNEKNPLF